MRGYVYWCDLGYGEKPFVIVSNNGRNQHLGDYLAVRVTTTPKSEYPTRVKLEAGDGPPGLVGTVLCDDIVLLAEEDLRRFAGALTAHAMMRVGKGLTHALAL